MTADPQAPEIVIDVGYLVDADGTTIDILARLQLAARRLGRRIILRHASFELQELLAFAGLSDVLPISPDLSLKPRGKTEEREQGLGVEEEADPADPVA